MSTVMEMAARELVYTVVLRCEPEGGYTVLVPALPEIVSYGEDTAEALRMARDAIELVLQSRGERREDVPVEAPGKAYEIGEEELTGPIALIRVAATVEERAIA